MAVYSTWALILKRRQKLLILSHTRVQKECLGEMNCNVSKENAFVLDKHGK